MNLIRIQQKYLQQNWSQPSLEQQSQAYFFVFTFYFSLVTFLASINRAYSFPFYNHYYQECLRQAYIINNDILVALISFHTIIQPKIQLCPVLRPTIKQFQNFFQFVEKADQMYRNQYGMVKVKTTFHLTIVRHYPFFKLIQVIPPPQWRPRSDGYDHLLENLTIQGPIEQNTFGKGSIYECLLIQKKSMTLKEYQTKTGVFDKISQGLKSQQIEELFWKNVAYSPPLYGADLLNTLMDQSPDPWNLNNLDSILKYCLDTKVKGVNTPYCQLDLGRLYFVGISKILILRLLTICTGEKVSFGIVFLKTRATQLRNN